MYREIDMRFWLEKVEAKMRSLADLFSVAPQTSRSRLAYFRNLVGRQWSASEGSPVWAIY
jgi:hypothetical protein